MNVGAIPAYKPISYITPYANLPAAQGLEDTSEALMTGNIQTDALSAEQKVDKTDPNYKCQTCANRKYQDGSDENNVSFKSPTKVSPEAAASAVRSHEQMHVSNAFQKAEKAENAKVISANVTIHTSICPECGKSYVSGGTTRTQIKYGNEENPYQKNLKDLQGGFLRGINFETEI